LISTVIVLLLDEREMKCVPDHEPHGEPRVSSIDATNVQTNSNTLEFHSSHGHPQKAQKPKAKTFGFKLESG
jgi:hypothetical protein